MRTRLFADPEGVFLHDAILRSCSRHGSKEAIVDTSDGRRLTYSEYGDLVERTARGLVTAGIRPGEVIAIYLPNSWEYAVIYHAATLAGAVPTLLNPGYREREVRYQLGNSSAVALFTDGPLILDISLTGLPALRGIYCTRHTDPGARTFAELLAPASTSLPSPALDARATLAALPYSSGTTGLPKGVMLSHYNLVANIYQFLAPDETATTRPDDRVLCFLPLYHIYGLNVVLNPTLAVGATLVLMPRFDVDHSCDLVSREQITYLPQVPPVMNALCQAAEAGKFPAYHNIRSTKSGAAPLAPELPRRFTALTGIPVRQGYGMTEASPVTHIGYCEPHLVRADTIGHPAALTECRVVDELGSDVPPGLPGELVMRGPQFMSGYWNAPEATAAALREGWYWSGDVVVVDEDGFYRIVDRRKELIKYKGFAIAPAEVEAVLLEHASVKDCGVVGLKDEEAGEVPLAFVVLREGQEACARMARDLCGYVAERLVGYKQPRQVRFVSAIPRNPSGKILRKDLRAQL
ncbi:MAG: AMP-binding protein [Acidobacteriales bacterium]|nr:AMP-binding protein [Terriglobales bacterium]